MRRVLLPSLPVPSRRTLFTYPSPRLLKDIVKLPLLAMESTEKIETVWHERHFNDMARVGRIISQSKFDLLMSNSKQFPMFIFPVHRPSGYIVLVSQFQDRHCLLTGLEAYQKQGSSAHPICVLTFYDELKEKKNVVLARCDITDPIVTKNEVQRLYDDIVFTYTADGPLQSVREFNLRPSEFDFEAYFSSSRG